VAEWIAAADSSACAARAAEALQAVSPWLAQAHVEAP